MLQLGIIGAGRMGRVHIQGICSGVPGARIRAIAAPHLRPEIRELARQAGAQVLTEDYREVLRDPRSTLSWSALPQTPMPPSPWRPWRPGSTFSVKSPWIFRLLKSKRSLTRQAARG